MSETISVIVNGLEQRVMPACTVTHLLEEFDLAPIRVAVEINRELVSRKDFGTTGLSEGDTVEIVTFVGGG